MMNGDEGGQLSDLIGGDTVLMRRDIRLIGGDPPQSPPPLGKTLQIEHIGNGKPKPCTSQGPECMVSRFLVSDLYQNLIN